jgi:hypothetical protein
LTRTLRSAGICLYGNHEAADLWDGKCPEHLRQEQRTIRRSRPRQLWRATLGLLWLLYWLIKLLLIGTYFGVLFGVSWLIATHRFGVW